MATDKQLVALSKSQRHEVDHIVTFFDIPKETVLDVVWHCGRSRAIIYAVLKKMGWALPEQKTLNPKQKKRFEAIIQRMGL